MYLRRIRLESIKCFDDIELSFLDEKDQIRRWTALLGTNGLGKSTLLQAMAVALAGPGATGELLPVAEGWVRVGKTYGTIEAELDWSEGDAQVEGWPKKTPYTVKYLVAGDDPEALPIPLEIAPTVPSIIEWSGEGDPREREKISKGISRLKRTAYAEGKAGWLACGYGPFRRLSGGSQDADRILYSGRKSARFVTLFREDAALTNATEWLIKLHNTGREGDTASQRALTVVKKAFSESLLPEPSELQVDARSAQLRVGGGSPITFRNLSDGYRSMLALGIDLLRWLIAAFPDSDTPENCPGVVVIDELDAHLHPAWQQRIGQFLMSKFPRLQFIVATHSPFLAQVSQDTGGNVILFEKNKKVSVSTDHGAVNTWRADQILTDLFGLNSTRSPEMQAKLREYVILEGQKRARKLTIEEEEKYKQLEFFFATIPPSIEDPQERAIAENLRRAVDARSDEISQID